MATWCWSYLPILALISTVTGVSMVIQDTSLVEGQTLQITCQQDNLGTDTLYSLGLQRLDTSGTYETVVTYDYSSGNIYFRSWGNTGWQSRANTTESFNTDLTGGSFVFMLGSVLCNDASTFRCRAATSRNPPLDPTPSQNVTIHGPNCPNVGTIATTRSPVIFQRNTSTVNNITQTSAVLLIDMRDPPTQPVSTGYNLRCDETPGQRLALNIDIEKKDASWGNGTARFSLSGLFPGQTYQCQVSSRTASGAGWTDNFSFMTKSMDTVSTTRRPITFQRDKASVRNITQNSAVLLIDMRDPPTQMVSTGYNLHCVETPEQRIAVNIDIEKKDATWGNGTARFSLAGLSPGQMYRCEASSRTVLGPGWIDNFFFMTIPTEARKNPFNQFTWKHAAGLGSVGLLLLLGVFIAQHQSG